MGMTNVLCAAHNFLFYSFFYFHFNSRNLSQYNNSLITRMNPEGGSLPIGELSAKNVDNILCDEEVPDSAFRKPGTQLT